MSLNINDLGEVLMELWETRAKAYNIGLMLKVPNGSLECIKKLTDPSDQLRDMLQAWLQMAAQQNWKTIVEALQSPVIREPALAAVIEKKYCQGRPVALDTKVPQEPIPIMLDKQRLVAQPQPNPPRQMTLMKLKWRDCHGAPEEMCMGSVATDGPIAYFNGGGTKRVHQYHSDSQRWSKLPNLLHTDSTLVMADSKLTSVGGKLDSGEATNSLLSLTGGSKWLPLLPPMDTKRAYTAAICYHRSLIVAGGHNGRNTVIAAVEVLDMDTQRWFIARSLPHPSYQATTSICGDRLYMVGGFDHSGTITCSVFACSIPELLDSSRPGKSTVWQQLADADYKSSSCATLDGKLVAVGGYDKYRNAENTTAIRTYDENTNCWKITEPMTTARHQALVASFHDNTLIVVGGRGKRRLPTVEMAKIL